VAGPPIEVIRAGLLARVNDLAGQLCPDQPRVQGAMRWSLNPMRADRTPGSFKIDISGAHKGRWYDFAESQGGDLIDLIAYCRCGHKGHYKSREARGEAIKWAISWLGLAGADPAEMRKAEARAEAARKDMDRQRLREDKRRAVKARNARKDWIAALPLTARPEPVWRYLRDVRGIDPDQLTHLPGALRFEPDGPLDPHLVQSDPESGEIFPAIVTCAANARGRIRGVHRTFLMPDGSGKAPIDRPKRMYGSVRGCALRLAKGKSRKSPEQYSREGGRDDVLAISEGIEDGLSWALMQPGHRVWAAGSLDLIGFVVVPECVCRVILLAQNDDPGGPAAQAFERAANRLQARSGATVEIARPKDRAVKDWNDLWRAS